MQFASLMYYRLFTSTFFRLNHSKAVWIFARFWSYENQNKVADSQRVSWQSAAGEMEKRVPWTKRLWGQRPSPRLWQVLLSATWRPSESDWPQVCICSCGNRHLWRDTRLAEISEANRVFCLEIGFKSILEEHFLFLENPQITNNS